MRFSLLAIGIMVSTVCALPLAPYPEATDGQGTGTRGSSGGPRYWNTPERWDDESFKKILNWLAHHGFQNYDELKDYFWRLFGDWDKGNGYKSWDQFWKDNGYKYGKDDGDDDDWEAKKYNDWDGWKGFRNDFSGFGERGWENDGYNNGHGWHDEADKWQQ